MSVDIHTILHYNIVEATLHCKIVRVHERLRQVKL